MKNIYLILAAVLLFSSCGPVTVIQSDSYQPAPAEPAPDVSYQSFYDQLAPYGNWINYPGYGYVWMPNEGPDFQPYATNGNWIYTDAGWTWASNYSWGWAPFHYGRWFYENGYGWMWVPGNEWAPAWVSWRGGGDYYGWAPLGPRISVDVALSNYNPPANYWNFVPRRYMGNPDWHNYYVDGGRNVTIINNTTIINNYSGSNRARYSYAPGPDANEVRRYSGNNFTPVQIRQANTPGARMNGSQYQIYQPRVSASNAARGDTPGRPSTPAPARYESFNNVRPSATQYQNNNQQPQNNPRPAQQTQPVNNQPTYNAQPSNNPRPATQNPPVNQQPVQQNQPANNQPANNHMNDVRANQFRQTPQPAQQPVQNRTMPQPSPVNHVQTQTTGRPATDHNPNNGHPVQRTPAPENKPAPKPADKPADKPVDPPKTRSAN